MSRSLSPAVEAALATISDEYPHAAATIRRALELDPLAASLIRSLENVATDVPEAIRVSNRNTLAFGGLCVCVIGGLVGVQIKVSKDALEVNAQSAMQIPAAEGNLQRSVVKLLEESDAETGTSQAEVSETGEAAP